LIEKTTKVQKSKAKQVEVEVDLGGGWLKYTKRPPKGVTMKKMTLHDALLLVYDCYAKKIKADETDDRSAEGESRRQRMNDFIADFFVTRYGLKKVAEGYLYGLVHTVLRHEKKGEQEDSVGIVVFRDFLFACARPNILTCRREATELWAHSRGTENKHALHASYG
jgi:hypothetical protein